MAYLPDSLPARVSVATVAFRRAVSRARASGRAQPSVDTPLETAPAPIPAERSTAASQTDPEIRVEPKAEPAVPYEPPVPYDESVGALIADLLEEVGVGLIAAFLDDAERGLARDSSGRAYTPEAVRDLRTSLSDVDPKLALVGLEATDGRQMDGVLDDLRRQGFPPAHVDATMGALRALRRYAAQHRPAAGYAPAEPARREPALATPAPAPEPAHDPPVYRERSKTQRLFDQETYTKPRYEQPAYTHPTYAQPAYTEPAPPELAHSEPSPAQMPYSELKADSSPTLELLAAARRFAAWTTRTTVFLFVLLVVLVIFEF